MTFFMFNREITDIQEKEINKIVNKFISQARRSKKETAFQDAYRKGMDAVQDYCCKQNVNAFGDHMVKASRLLSNI